MNFASSAIDRRSFLPGTAAVGAGLLTDPFSLSAADAAERPDYRGPNVILIRSCGGNGWEPAGSRCWRWR